MTQTPALMARRIRRILLVCNNYDNFSLEEDGRLAGFIKVAGAMSDQGLV